MLNSHCLTVHHTKDGNNIKPLSLFQRPLSGTHKSKINVKTLQQFSKFAQFLKTFNTFF